MKFASYLLGVLSLLSALVVHAGTSDDMLIYSDRFHTGWRLQVQTNAPGVGLGANWITLFGSELTNSSTLPVDVANGNVFLRLISP